MHTKDDFIIAACDDDWQKGIHPERLSFFFSFTDVFFTLRDSYVFFAEKSLKMSSGPYEHCGGPELSTLSLDLRDVHASQSGNRILFAAHQASVVFLAPCS